MKRKTLVISGIAAAAVVAIGAGYAYATATNRPEVSVVQVTSGELTASVSASGTLSSAHTAGVYAPAGTIATVLVADGDQVKAGDTLATVSTGPLKLAVAQAKAAVSAAAAQLDAVNRGVPAAIDKSAAKSALSAARSQVSTANSNYAAYLSDYNAASGADQDAMRSTLRTLRTAKATANAALKSAEAQLSQLSRAGRVGLARTAANDASAAAKRALALAEANLKKAELTAPFDGTVSFAGTVEKGSAVAPGVPVFRITDPGKLRFDAAVNESDIAQVAKDQTATVTLDAFDEPFTGTVTRVHSDAKTASTGGVSFTVEIGIDVGDKRAFTGMSGSAEIATQTAKAATVVPTEAVLTKGTDKMVFVVGGDSVAHLREVRVGIGSDTSVEILSGLAEGEQVVTIGAASLTDGQQVRVSA